ncbi:MAG: M50 family metallopeptidase [Capsulimonadaceae bacterium]|nr:M50 family metallopeptidase [Capsulimonadaceae bacterium]
MDILVTAIVLVILLGVLVIAHEWGHFIVARIFGIRVDEFSIGWGPLAVRMAKHGDTEYTIRWIPIGGFVKIAGMEADEEPILVAKEKVRGLAGLGESDAHSSEIPLVAENTPDRAETDEQRARDDKDGFYSKPIWQRSLVIFAGPFMSFLLGLLIFCNMGWTTGFPASSNKVSVVNKGSEASRMGLLPGDHVININGKPISTVDAMISTIHGNCGKPLTVIVARGNARVTLHGTPRPLKDDAGKLILDEHKQPIGVFGFEPGSDTRRIGFISSWRRGFLITADVFEGLKMVFSHPATIRENTGSIITIGAITQSAVQHGPDYIALVAGQLTISLAVFNLLPIPILDGGHLLIFFIEAVRRGRRLTMQQQQNFMLAGLVCIGLLFIAVMSNDIMKAIHHQLPRFP